MTAALPPYANAWRGRPSYGNVQGCGRWSKREEYCADNTWREIYTATTPWGDSERFAEKREAVQFLVWKSNQRRQEQKAQRTER